MTWEEKSLEATRGLASVIMCGYPELLQKRIPSWVRDRRVITRNNQGCGGISDEHVFVAGLGKELNKTTNT